MDSSLRGNVSKLHVLGRNCDCVGPHTILMIIIDRYFRQNQTVVYTSQRACQVVHKTRRCNNRCTDARTRGYTTLTQSVKHHGTAQVQQQRDRTAEPSNMMTSSAERASAEREAETEAGIESSRLLHSAVGRRNAPRQCQAETMPSSKCWAYRRGFLIAHWRSLD